jgi:diketogulonate reductase-like aldo/keto reductase
LLLAKILCRGGNFLVLDEPTNDLDLATLQVLEEALLEYKGCGVVVSHDRWFLDRICDRVIVFEENGPYVQEGNYSYYLEKSRDRLAAERSAAAAAAKVAAAVAAAAPKAKEKARKLTWKEERELEGLEGKIMELEEAVAAIEAQLGDPAFFVTRAAEAPGMIAEVDARKVEIQGMYARWEELAGLLDTALASADANAEAAAQARESAASLGFTPDLLLLHWPKRAPTFAETLGALNEAKDQGLTRTIGLSNFPSAGFLEAQALSPAKLVTNQVEYHPWLKLSKLIETAKGLGSSITAWSPLAQGAVADDPTLTEIGKAHGKTPGQVTLRWLIQQNVITIPRTSKVSRAEENFDIFDFRLPDEEMDRIHALARPDGRLGDWLDPAFKWDDEWA